MTDAPGAVLAAHGLTLLRGNRALFSGLSFSVAPGQMLVLRGANGSGKTSLLRVLAGLVTADEGRVSFAGTVWRGLVHDRRMNTLYLGHANGLKDDLTADENLADLAAFDGGETIASARLEALTRVGLAERRHVPARRLSQGQKRRIGLARLALARRRLWLLDEPTNALDREGVELFAGIVQAHLRQGGLACVATHLPLAIEAPMIELQMGAS
jgi:heme exporter protein A